MEMPADVPFAIEPAGEQRVIVRFARRCDHARRKQHEDTLSDLVESHRKIACDLSRTAVISSDWLRWLARLTSRARRTGKVLVLVGMNATLRETADALGLADVLWFTESVEEVWRQ